MNEDDKPTIPDENTITFKRSHLYAALLPLAFAAGLAVGYIFWGRDTGLPTSARGAAVEQPTNEAVQKVTRYDVPVDDDPFLGPEDAAITIIEFSDFECPYCTKWHNQVWTRIMEEYPDQVRLVYRDFPLSSIHSNAIPAAEAANCAGEQGVYWKYHDLLFNGDYGLGDSAFIKYANQLDLDEEAFQECLTSRRYQEEVENDFTYAANLGVRSTPTFFINGIPVVGAQPFEVFQEIIEKELAGEIP